MSSRLLTQMLPKDLARRTVLQKHIQLLFEPLIGYLVQCAEADEEIILSGSYGEIVFLPDFEFHSEHGSAILSESVISKTKLNALFVQTNPDRLVYPSLERAKADVGASSNSGTTENVKTKQVVVLDLEGCNPGFVRLAIYASNDDSGELTFKEYLGDDISLPSKRYPLATTKAGSPSITTNGDVWYNQDNVFAQKLVAWPEFLQNIWTRTNASGWPDEKTRTELKSSYVLLVHKKDELCAFPDEQQFRISFSLQEQILCWSLTDELRHAFLVTKILCKIKLNGTEYRTYYLKTQLFRLLSEISIPELEATPEEEIIKMLLRKLQHCFRMCWMEHFFVSGFNIFKSVTGCSDVCSKLDELLDKFEEHVLEVSKNLVIEDYRPTDDSREDLLIARAELSQAMQMSSPLKEVLIEQVRMRLLKAEKRTPASLGFRSLLIEMVLFYHRIGDTSAARRLCELHHSLWQPKLELGETETGIKKRIRFVMIEMSEKYLYAYDETLQQEILAHGPVLLMEAGLLKYILVRYNAFAGHRYNNPMLIKDPLIDSTLVLLEYRKPTALALRFQAMYASVQGHIGVAEGDHYRAARAFHLAHVTGKHPHSKWLLQVELNAILAWRELHQEEPPFQPDDYDRMLGMNDEQRWRWKQYRTIKCYSVYMNRGDEYDLEQRRAREYELGDQTNKN